MIYADYAYYQGIYGGSALSPDAFKQYARENSKYLDFVTQNRITEITDLIKDTLCELCDSEYAFDNYKAVASESVGSSGVSVSYQTKDTQDKQKVESIKYNICKKNLGFTGLMFRGID